MLSPLGVVLYPLSDCCGVRAPVVSHTLIYNKFGFIDSDFNISHINPPLKRRIDTVSGTESPDKFTAATTALTMTLKNQIVSN